MPAEDVTVEQVDRDAAGAVMISREAREAAVAGRIDGNAVVQAFARHRIQHSASTPLGDGETVEQAAISLIVDLIGPGASQSSTNVRLVEDHLKQFAASLSPRPLPTREEVAEAAYTAHVKRNKPWARESLHNKERWRASADAILALLRGEKAS